MATKKKAITTSSDSTQQSLDLGPEAKPGGFNLSLQTQVFSTFENQVGVHISKGLRSTDLIPFFIQDRKQVSLTGRVTADEATRTRLIEIEGRSALLVQSAANIKTRVGKNKGTKIFRHLGEREETVLDALKYIASRSPRNFGEYRGNACLRFSINQILSVIDGSYNRYEVLEALDVLAGSQTELILDVDDEHIPQQTLKSPLLNVLLTSDDPEVEDLFDGQQATFMCTFHPSITMDLANLNFRQINYIRIRARRSGLAKYIEKRLSHNYIQASDRNKFGPIKASSLLRSAGLAYDKTRRTDSNFKPIWRAFDELVIPKGVSFDTLSDDEKDTYILEKVDIEPIIETSLLGRERIIDYKFTMHPTSRFIQQQIDANIAANIDRERYETAKKLGVSPDDVPNIKVGQFRVVEAE